LIKNLNDKVIDNRLINLLYAAYSAGVLGSGSFCLESIELLRVLRNLFLINFDSFVKKEILVKMNKGGKSYLSKICSSKLVKKMLKLQQKEDLNRIIKQGKEGDIKYMRNTDILFFGIYGSLRLVQKIKRKIKIFLTSNLYFNQKWVGNTIIAKCYRDKARFWDTLFFYKNAKNLHSLNVSAVENTKRVNKKKQTVSLRAKKIELKIARKKIKKKLKEISFKIYT